VVAGIRVRAFLVATFCVACSSQEESQYAVRTLSASSNGYNARNGRSALSSASNRYEAWHGRCAGLD
jgi:hypothetical protein